MFESLPMPESCPGWWEGSVQTFPALSSKLLQTSTTKKIQKLNWNRNFLAVGAEQTELLLQQSHCRSPWDWSCEKGTKTYSGSFFPFPALGSSWLTAEAVLKMERNAAAAISVWKYQIPASLGLGVTLGNCSLLTVPLPIPHWIPGLGWLRSLLCWLQLHEKGSVQNTTNHGQGSPKFQLILFFFIFIFLQCTLLNNVKKTLVIQKQILCGKRYSKCNIKQNNLTVQ